MSNNNTDRAKVVTLSRKEMREVATRRVAQIAKEFEEGFKFLEKYPQSVTFFGGNQTKEDDPYYQSARALASKIVKELNYSILSGGGPGIMEAANRGAFEAGGKSLGLLIQLHHAQVKNKYITEEMDYYYFFVRKVCLSFSAEAFIFFPGGFGTLDEFFEMLTLIQTKKIEGVPLICVGSEYWSKVKDLMKTEMLNRGFINSGEEDLFTITDDHDRIIEIIKNVPVRNGLPFDNTVEIEKVAE
ncbi:MAG: TIGR00730 family Rossman fold protein [Parcubacteria group bacterium]